MASKFTTHGKAILRAASRQKIEDHFSTLAKSVNETSFLDPKNHYRAECVSRYDAEVLPPPSKVKDADLLAYIAASAPAHVVDAWSFLGRAIDCTLRGDVYGAIHFGYYAELRAAVSLLAAEGICVLSGKHPVLDRFGKTTLLPKTEVFIKGKWEPRWLNTHKIVWPLLRQWSSLKRSSELLSQLIHPNGRPIVDWMAACGKRSPFPAIGKKWLDGWGIDLATIDEDHDCRNLASYRPSIFRKPPSVSSIDISIFVDSIWQLFEPSGDSRFPNLEKQLLKRALNQAVGPAPTAHLLQSNLSFTPEVAMAWATFLTSADVPLVLQFADQQSEVDQPNCHLQIISRAALLLGISTLASRRLLSKGGYKQATLDHWWIGHGVDRGLWSAISAPDNPLDTWQDISNALDDTRAWRGREAANSPTLSDLRTANPAAMTVLGGFDMAAVWGLMP